MIDVAIGLALVYLMLAVVVSGIHEFMGSVIDARGRMLRQGIRSLFCDATTLQQFGKPLLDQLYSHPLIGVLRNGNGLPSYIPSGTFAVAMADTMTRTFATGKPLFEGLPEVVSRMPEGEFKHTLQLLVLQAQGSPEKLKELLEGHFNNVMDRVSGWYKRRAQLIMFLIALLVAGFLNVDTLFLARQLIDDAELRNKLVARAEQVVAERKADEQLRSANAPDATKTTGADDQKLEKVEKQIADLKDEMAKLNLPVGWDDKSKERWRNNFMLVIAGWLITAFAGALGAPFWFDALSKLIPMRGSGNRPGGRNSAQSPPAANPATTVVVQPTPAAPPAAPAPSPGPGNDFEFSRLNAQDVAAIQRVLGFAEEQVTGIIGADTRAGIRAWQEANGRPATGLLDENTVMTMLYQNHP